jgi:hypothetical protein
MNKLQLKKLVRETLTEIGFYSLEAEDLVLGTIAQESAGGEYIEQINGPALGICQMEPATHDDIWKHWLVYKTSLQARIVSFTTSKKPKADELRWNLKYAIAMCRVFYLRKPGAIPLTLKSQAEYWKKHYNTYLGAGSVEEYIRNYKKYVE